MQSKPGWTSGIKFPMIAVTFQVRGNTRIGKLAQIEYCPRNGDEDGKPPPSPETGLEIILKTRITGGNSHSLSR